jgi:hypothetical protein
MAEPGAPILIGGANFGCKRSRIERKEADANRGQNPSSHRNCRGFLDLTVDPGRGAGDGVSNSS